MAHPYKPMESALTGDIFIIKSGLRQKKHGTFHSRELAQLKCNELNMEISSYEYKNNSVNSDDTSATGSSD